MEDTHALQVELSKTKFHEMLTELDTKKSVFSDKKCLESMGPPSSIIGREKEAKQILEILYNPANNYLAPLVSIYGPSGTGKSSIMKFLCENLSKGYSYSYANLREARTIFVCTNLILAQLDLPGVKSYEGTSLAFDKIESQIEQILTRDRKKRFILILDEFDAIFSDTRGKPSDFVFMLLNVVEKLRKKDFLVCIVTISNSCLSDFSLDDRVKSRMDSHEVFFAPYKTEEIFFILKKRSEKAFLKQVDDKIIEMCAKQSGEETGDCRRALHLFRVAGEIAEKSDTANEPQITIEHVKQAMRQLDGDKISQIVKAASPNQRFLLYGFASLVHHSEKEMYSTKEIYEKYESLDIGLTRRVSYRRAFDLLGELENSGIIIAKKNSDGRHGYHKYYQFTEDCQLVGSYIDRDLWDTERISKQRKELLDEFVKEEMNPKKYWRNREAIGKARKRLNDRFKD